MIIDYLKDNRFYEPSNHVYPPFKNGLYLEEYFMLYVREKRPDLKMNYIPALFTNFQTSYWFRENIIREMSESLNILHKELSHYDKDKKNFCVCQHDDGPQLFLPKNTVIFSASFPENCIFNTGLNFIPIPLIYEDRKNRLENVERINFNDKKFLCSFIGTITKSNKSDVRVKLLKKYEKNNNFYFSTNNDWSINVSENKSKKFIDVTKYSKFGLAPRGYGKTSFRFYEILQMGVIPIYVWDDVEWLPYKEFLDYSKFSISINIKNIDNLENILNNITEEKYNDMLNEYLKVKKWFSLQGMSEYIVYVVNNFNKYSELN
jgi:hypothetical protein